MSTEQDQALPTEKPEEKTHEIRDIENTKTPALRYQKTFYFQWKDPDTQEIFSGNFTAKRPSIGDLSKMVCLKVDLCEGKFLGTVYDFINEMRAYLEITLKEKPDWWKPSEFYNEEPLRLVYKHVRAWEDSFRTRDQGK